MKNPWLKKNPFLSMWLSGANTMLGATRSRAIAEGKRQATSLMSQGATQMVRFWSNALMSPQAKKRAKKRN